MIQVSALGTFHFNGIVMRPADPRKDRDTAIKWTRADPDHRETTDGYFWLYQSLETESYVLEDKFGLIFFFRMDWVNQNSCEMHIQFPPPFVRADKRNEQKSRVMRAMTLGFEWMKRILAAAQVNEVFFVSKSPRLIQFTINRCGFEERDGRIVYDFHKAAQLEMLERSPELCAEHPANRIN